MEACVDAWEVEWLGGCTRIDLQSWAEFTWVDAAAAGVAAALAALAVWLGFTGRRARPRAKAAEWDGRRS